MNTARRPLFAILVASIVVIGAALLSQYWGNLRPCELCLIERWPYYTAIAIALLALLVATPELQRTALLVLALLFLASTSLGFYHVGVEQHWFPGPTACTNGGRTPQTLEELKQMLAHTQTVMCDEIQWSLWGISLAGWNSIISAIITTFSFFAWRHRA